MWAAYGERMPTLDDNACRPLTAREFAKIRQLAYDTFGLDLRAGKETSGVRPARQAYPQIGDAGRSTSTTGRSSKTRPGER
jgi:hypothetical protein